MKQLKNPLELYKILPQTNCGQCYVPTCLAFAAAVVNGSKRLSDCPYLRNNKQSDTVEIRPKETWDDRREQQLVVLKKQLTHIDLMDKADKIGGEFMNGKLAIKCLGKDFFVDSSCNVTSECHTHMGLTIPLLSYIIHSQGKPLSGKWVHFRELQNGAPMSALFERRGENALKEMFDTHTDLIETIMSSFSGKRTEKSFSSDVSLVLYPLPKLPVLICYWLPEDDLGSELSMFFDAAADTHLPIDSIFELGVGLVMMFKKISTKHS
jgi:hypothetical protein